MGLLASRRDKEAFNKKIQEFLDMIEEDHDQGGSEVCKRAERGNRAAAIAAAPMYEALDTSPALRYKEKAHVHKLLKKGKFGSAMAVGWTYGINLRRHLPKERQ